MTDISTRPTTRSHVSRSHSLMLSFSTRITAVETPAVILSDIEFREIAQATIAACYDISERLGFAAEYWVDYVLNICDGAGALCAEKTHAKELVNDVREVSRRVHLEETGLPASW